MPDPPSMRHGVGMALRDLGFDELQETVYRALLREPDADLARLASLAEVTADAVEAALAWLAERGVLRPDPTRRAGFAAVNPAVAVTALVEQAEHELRCRYRGVVETRSELLELTAGCRHVPAGRPMAEVERVTCPDAVTEVLAELTYFMRASAYLVHPGGQPVRNALDARQPLPARALRRGIDLRVLCHRGVLDDPAEVARVRELHAAGAQFRLAEKRLDPLIILDESVVVLPAGKRDTCGALVVRQPRLLTGIVELYRRRWAEGEPLEWDARPQPSLADADRKVLRLLASGVTDETAAREVGWSTRHLRRRLAMVMVRLGASSRFEAGATAARLGWI
jgi:sugar-specific transcriptional regulator TrmB